jgi:addiction module HigA family antidote
MSSELTSLHPGEILLEKFLIPLGISQLKLARDVNIPLRRINEICRGKRGVTPDTAIRLGLYFQMAAEFWLILQVRYELTLVQDKEGARIKREVRTFSDGVSSLVLSLT